jgi:biopolymer transport protein ExbB
MKQRIIICMLAALAIVAGRLQAQEPLNLGEVLAEPDGETQTEAAELEPGDNRRFTVTTDDDTTSLAVDDVYKCEQALYKVVEIRSKGAKGGSFVVERIAGKAEPTRKWNRVSGLGPLTIFSRETLWSLYLAGGFLMHPIALCLVAVIVIVLNSLLVFRRSRQCPTAFVDQARQALRRGDIREFENLSMREKGLFGHICRAMAVKFDSSSLEDIKVRCEIEGGRQVNLLRTPLKALQLISAVAPLLGLLGTVIGMVLCFESLAFESASASKAAALAAGIRVALFTTVAGMSVAIPALFALFVFNQKLSGVGSDCESLTEEFIHEIAVLKRTTLNDAATTSKA